MNEVDCAALAVAVYRLSGLAPPTIQKAICRRNAGRWRRFSRVHDAGKGGQCALCVASR